MAQSSTSSNTTVTQDTNHPTIDYSLTIIKDKDNIYSCEPVDGVTLTRGRNLVPAKLTFKVPKDDVLDFTEGNAVAFKVNDTAVFNGYVFEKSHDKDNIISVMCYDSLRYLKSKDCLVYKNKTASELIKEICSDYKLPVDDSTGGFADTQVKISHVEDNKSLADIIMYAINYTEIYGKGHPIYECYSDCGKICLKNIMSDALTLDVMIDADVTENYTYRTSIDKETYDIVKVIREAPGDKGKSLVKTGEVRDDSNVEAWGHLQYLIRPDTKDTTPIEQAKRFLTLHDCKTREMHLKNVIGDVRVRGGSRVFVNFDFGDIKVSSYLMVTNVTHNFTQNFHGMDIDLYYPEPAGAWKVTYDNDAATLQKIKASEASTSKSGSAYSCSSNGTYSQTEQGAYSKMKSLGATDNQAAGVMGNIRNEDVDYDPYASNGNHYGLFQLDENRWSKYKEWCDENGNDYYCNDNQIEYVCTVENGNLFDQMPDDASGSAKWFNDNIEVSETSAANYGDSSDRISSANLVSQDISNGSIGQESLSYPETYSDVGSSNTSLVDAGISKVMNGNTYFGPDGCVKSATEIASYYNADMANAYNDGVVGVDSLCTYMTNAGYQVDSFDGYADKGDVLVWSNQHVAISDGVGGCYTNSTGAGYQTIHIDNVHAVTGSDDDYPDSVIHMDKS